MNGRIQHTEKHEPQGSETSHKAVQERVAILEEEQQQQQGQEEGVVSTPQRHPATVKQPEVLDMTNGDVRPTISVLEKDDTEVRETQQQKPQDMEELDDAAKDEVDDAAKDEVGEEPKEELDEKPEEELDEKPEEELDEKPEDELDEEPKEELDEEPKEELDEKPEDELDEEPKEELDEKPEEELDEKPEDELDEEPKEELHEEPKNEQEEAPKAAETPTEDVAETMVTTEMNKKRQEILDNLSFVFGGLNQSDVLISIVKCDLDKVKESKVLDEAVKAFKTVKETVPELEKATKMEVSGLRIREIQAERSIYSN